MWVSAAYTWSIKRAACRVRACVRAVRDALTRANARRAAGSACAGCLAGWSVLGHECMSGEQHTAGLPACRRLIDGAGAAFSLAASPRLALSTSLNIKC